MAERKYQMTYNGEVHEIPEEKVNKNGWEKYAEAFPGATLRMRGKSGKDHQIPLGSVEAMMAEGLHPWTIGYYQKGKEAAPPVISYDTNGTNEANGVNEVNEAAAPTNGVNEVNETNEVNEAVPTADETMPTTDEAAPAADETVPTAAEAAGVSALERVPRDEAGVPQYHKAENAETGWDALVESYAGEDFTPEEQAEMAAEHAKAELEAAQKAPKIKQEKGEPLQQWIMRKKRAEKEQAATAKMWEAIAAVPAKREQARVDAEEKARAERSRQANEEAKQHLEQENKRRKAENRPSVEEELRKLAEE